MQTTKSLKLMALLCLTLLLSNIQAQIDSFQISDYKLADYKRQGIDLNFNLSGSNSKQETSYDIYDSYSKSKGFGNIASGRYFLNINTRSYQGNHGIFLSNNMSISDYESDNYNSKTTDISSQVSLNTTNRFYGKKEIFFHFSLSGNISARDEMSKRNSDTVENHSTNNSALSSIGFGKGRIETVTDARQALYILNELKKSNRLKREPTHDEIYELSEYITKALNERVLDSRLKKIYELTLIDSVLLSMDLIETTDMVYFSNLNDMWDFGGNQFRTSGFRMELVYIPTYTFSIENNYYSPNVKMNENRNSFINSFQYDIEWHKPFKQKFQSNLYYDLGYFINSNNGMPENGLQSSLRYEFGLYPNTRTSMFFGTSLSARKTWEIETEQDYFDYGFRPYFRMDYYFSPKLSLNANLGLDFNHVEDYSKIDSSNNYLAIGLVYSIF